MIFLSHTNTDKPVVEPVALRLREIFGQDNIFYDSWSIQPGDGIIDRMNEGLFAPDFVFVFFSKASLESGMVSLEWQNALYSSTRKKTKIIPVRVDGTPMPAVLSQSKYIDMYTNGVNSAFAEILSIIDGRSSYTPQHQEFENLTYDIEPLRDVKGYKISINASHLLEAIDKIYILTNNTNKECDFLVGDTPIYQDYIEKVEDKLGGEVNIFIYSPFGGSGISPRNPWVISFIQTGDVPLKIEAVCRREGDDLIPIPPKSR